MIFAVGDAVWNALITGVVAIILAWIGRKKLDEMAKVGRQTHTLVNSNMAVQLKISASALRMVATLQPTPDNIAAATLAEKLFKEHEAKQASIDAKENK